MLSRLFIRSFTKRASFSHPPFMVTQSSTLKSYTWVLCSIQLITYIQQVALGVPVCMQQCIWKNLIAYARLQVSFLAPAHIFHCLEEAKENATSSLHITKKYNSVRGSIQLIDLKINMQGKKQNRKRQGSHLQIIIEPRLCFTISNQSRRSPGCQLVVGGTSTTAQNSRSYRQCLNLFFGLRRGLL